MAELSSKGNSGNKNRLSQMTFHIIVNIDPEIQLEAQCQTQM
jgi:hypothetical protein